jgi:hypothetical protein
MKKHLKKFLAIVLILSLGGVCGCETLKNAFCSPTAEAVASAAEKLIQAEATMAYLAGLVPVPEVAAAIAALQIAIPILRKIKDGICVDPAEEAAANQVAVTSLKYAGALGFSGGK